MDDIAHLTIETSCWYTATMERYRLSAEKKRTLLVAAEAFDRAKDCREQVAASGLMVFDR